MNALVGEKLSIITPKAQTTRHKVIGILTNKHRQIVFTDTPGITQPKYQLHQRMMAVVEETTKDADVLLVLCDGFETPEELALIREKLEGKKVPLLFVQNKIDLFPDALDAAAKKNTLETYFGQPFFPISATGRLNLKELLASIDALLPEHEAYYPADDLSDKNLRFFVSEMIREKIFLLYHKEIPYSSEVQIVEFKEKEDITVIRSEVLVERESQKAILLGNQGLAIKKLGTQARKDMEKFLRGKVYLELTVKVKDNWRNDERQLKHFGY